jgi:hypothetical protein
MRIKIGVERLYTLFLLFRILHTLYPLAKPYMKGTTVMTIEIKNT